MDKQALLNASGLSEISEKSLQVIQAILEAERGPLTTRSSQTESSGKLKLFSILLFLNQFICSKLKSSAFPFSSKLPKFMNSFDA